MLDSKALTFLTVCEEMNFTRAAACLHITQPAVTQQIHSLEEYYGVPLFEFSGKKFELTLYGRLVYEELRGIRNNDIYIKERILEIKDRHASVNMGATLTVGEYMMSGHIAEFLKKYPDADISMQVANTHELLRMLDDGEIDFAVLEGNYPRNAYRHLLISEEKYAGICAFDSPLGKSTGYSLAELKSQHLILREKGSGTRDIFEDILEENDMSVGDFAGVTVIGNMRAIIELVRSGCGISFLYTDAVKDMIREKKIRQIHVKGFPVLHEISAVWKNDNLQDRYLRDMIYSLFRL